MIKVTKGATCNILATAYDENAVPIDLTTYSAEFAVKLKVSDPDPPLILLTNGAGVTYLNQATNPGQLRVVIEKEVTDTLSGGECWCDLHISLGSARYQVIENTRMVVTVPVNLLGGGSPATPGQPSGYGHFVKKATAGTIAAGVPVYGVSYSAGYLLVEAAQHGVTPDAFGIMSTAVTNVASGYATVIGTIGGVNTSGMSVGDRVFLGSSAFVTSRSPGRQELARVMVVSASAGVLNVNVGQSDVIKRLTPTTWANVDLLAADPVAPVVRDIWGRTDNRLALRGDDAVTRYVWFTPTQPIADASGAGAGLTLGAGPTLNVGANVDGSITVNADDIQVGVLATDAQHGVRGGGALHANAIAAGAAGFMTGADKSKLDGIASSAAALTAAAPADVTKATAAVGVASGAARADHKHDISTAAAVDISTANAEGVAATLARSDHTHQIPAASVALAKLVNASGASLLVGRGSAAGAGSLQEITLGTNLALTGTVLNATAVADWSLSLCRFYFVDYINGNDNNAGFVNAAPGTVFTPATVRALAVKTIEQVQLMQPRQGAGRQMVTLLWGDKTLSAPIEYFRKDGTTRDWWDRSGYVGYVTNLVRASDFTNDADDHVRCAAYVSSAGPNGDGSWTVNSFSAPVITNSAGTLPAFPTTEGACLHFATLTKCCAVKYRRSATTLEVTDNLAPVGGDTYLITRPSVKIASVIGIDDNANTPQVAAGTSFRIFGTTFVGLELAGFAPTFANSTSFRAEMSKVTLCKVALTGFTIIRMIAVSGFQMNGIYIDESGLAPTPGLSFHVKAPAGTANLGITIVGAAGAQAFGTGVPSIARVVATADVSQNVIMTIAGVASAANAPFLMSSAIHGVVLFSNLLVMGNNNTPNGLGGNNVASRLFVRPQIAGTSTAIQGGIVFLGGVKASLANTIIGNVLAGSALTFNGVGNEINLSSVVQDTDANTNYGCSLVGSVVSGSLNTSDNTLTLGAGNTVTGALGDVLFEPGVVKAWAAITQGLASVNNTKVTVQNQTVGAFRRVTIDTLANAPVLAADPASPADGDIWLTNIAGVRSMCARIGGTTYRSTMT